MFRRRKKAEAEGSIGVEGARESRDFQAEIRVLEDAYLVRVNEELEGRVAEALDGIVATGAAGSAFLVQWLLRDLSLSGNALRHPSWGDMTWNAWLQKREVIRALARGGADSALVELKPLLDAQSDDAQFHQIMRPALQEALRTG